MEKQTRPHIILEGGRIYSEEKEHCGVMVGNVAEEDVDYHNVVVGNVSMEGMDRDNFVLSDRLDQQSGAATEPSYCSLF